MTTSNKKSYQISNKLFNLQDHKPTYTVLVMNFSQRLKAARHHAGLTQRQLADAVRVTQPVISQIENGASLKSVHTSKIAATCGVNHLWLAEGIGDMLDPTDENSAELNGSSHRLQPALYSVPLISLNQAFTWTKGGFEMSDSKTVERLPCPVPVGKRAFAFRMQNDSMVGTRSDKSIYEGWAVFIDPDSVPEPGQIALASINGGEPILGVLTLHGGRTYIKPANAQYEMELVNTDSTDWCLGRAVFTGYAM